jgi:hypothetical protein
LYCAAALASLPFVRAIMALTVRGWDMSGSMPYLLDKGPYFSVVEDLLSTQRERFSRLHALKAGDASGVNPVGSMLAELCGFDSQNLAGDGHDEDWRKDHLNHDWFGMTGSSAGGNWAKNASAPTTGWWAGYRGDPEAILREGMIRAIEVGCGLDHRPNENPLLTSSPRFWPIDVTWICQGPYFQCWIMWQKFGDGTNAGKVTVLITTPAGDGFPLTSKITRNKPPTTADASWPGSYAEYADSRNAPPNHPNTLLDPAGQNRQRGMWVIGHEDYTPTPGITILRFPDYESKEGDDSSKGTNVLQIALPILEWRATDPNTIVCVRPAEREGGVLAAGRPY